MLRGFIALLCRGQARRGSWEADWLAAAPEPALYHRWEHFL